jgi:hypothetical protein
MTPEIRKVLNTEVLENVYRGNFKFWTDPSINIGSRSRMNFVNIENEKIKIKPDFPNDFFNLEINYFKEKASKRIANCVEFVIVDSQISEIKEYWDEKIIEDFNNNLPKSKRGKIKAWYDNEELWEEYLKKQEKNNNIS